MKVFTNVQELRSRYGLSPSAGNDERPTAPGDSSRIRPVQFHTSYLRFQTPLARNEQSLGMLNRMRWAVRDWKKLTLMVDDLMYFNNGLETITNSIEARERRS